MVGAGSIGSNLSRSLDEIDYKYKKDNNMASSSNINESASDRPETGAAKNQEEGFEFLEDHQSEDLFEPNEKNDYKFEI